MDWTMIVGETLRLASEAAADFADAEASLEHGKRTEADRCLKDAARSRRREKELALKRHLSELKARENLLLLAPKDFPGVQEALANVRGAMEKYRARGFE